MTKLNCHSYDDIGENVYSAVLENGLKINIVPKPGFKTSYAVFAVNYGGAATRFELDGEIHETPDGIAHFLEHKMFELPDGDNAMTQLSLNGADPNAFTASDITAYYFSCTDNFYDNLRTLIHFVSTPYFTPETVAKEQGIIGQEISMGDDSPAIRVYYALLDILYEHHPIRRKVIGTVESIARITDETLYKCHRIFYAPGNMALCVEGDIDPEKVVSIAEEMLDKEARSVPRPDFGGKESIYPREHRHCDEFEISNPQFYIGAKIIPEADGEALLRQKLISQLALRILIGSSSPFYTRLYTQGLLNRDYEYEVDFSCGTATLLIGGESKDPEKVLSELMSEADRVREAGLDEAAFTRAKQSSFGSRLRALEDFESVCLSNVTGIFSGYDALDSLAVLDSVSIEECTAFISEVFMPERTAISILTPKRSAQ